MDSPNHRRDGSPGGISPGGKSPGGIRHLQRKEIDIAKWDACISLSPAGLLYSRSFFLDAITGGNWDALVLDDYSAIMPLPKKKKFGFAYSYFPPLAGQLGIIGP